MFYSFQHMPIFFFRNGGNNAVTVDWLSQIVMGEWGIWLLWAFPSALA
jgi:hypothetical protein